jgi:hypothetical protein
LEDWEQKVARKMGWIPEVAGIEFIQAMNPGAVQKQEGELITTARVLCEPTLNVSNQKDQQRRDQ